MIFAQLINTSTYFFTTQSPLITTLTKKHIDTKLGHNVWNRKLLKEFNYECNWDRIVRVMCPNQSAISIVIANQMAVV